MQVSSHTSRMATRENSECPGLFPVFHATRDVQLGRSQVEVASYGEVFISGSYAAGPLSLPLPTAFARRQSS